MANLKDVIYISNEDYSILVSTGTVTIDGETLTYDENNVYITPDVLASSSEDGLMSSSDKVKLDSISSGAEVNAINNVQINGTSIVTNKIANFLTNTAYNASSNKIATMADLPEGINVVTINNVTLPTSASGDDYTITQADYTKATSNSDCIVILKDTVDNTDFAIHRYNLMTTSPKSAYFIIAYPVSSENVIACLVVAITGVSSTYKAHVTLETTPLGKNYVLDNTKSSGIKFLEDVTYTSASSSGSNTVSKSTHTHSVVVSGTTGNDSGNGIAVASTTHTHPVTLTANTSTSTGRITYVESISSTGASASGTAKGGSETHTHTYDKTTGITLTANDETATGRITYIQDVTHTAASLTGTKTFNTDAIKSVTLSASETSTDGPTYVQSISGGSAVSPTTKYMKFNAGTTPPSSASFSGTQATITPTLNAGTTKYLEASLSNTGVTSDANSGSVVAAVTGYPNFSGGSGSLTSNDTSSGGIAYISTASHTAASLGTASTGTVTISNGSYSLSGSRATSGSGATARRTLTISLSGSAPSLGGTTTFVTGYPNFSGGSASHTTKYLHHTHSGASLGTASTSNVAPNGHTHTTSVPTSITLTAQSSTATGRIKYLEAQGTITGATYTPAGSVSLTSGTAPSMNFNTGTSTDTPYISAISGGSAVSATTRYMKATTTAAGTGTVGISGGSISKTTKYLSASPSTTSTNSGTPSATTTFVTGVTGGTTTATTKYLSASTSATTSTNTTVASHTHTHSYGSSTALTTGDGSNATATAISGITSGSLTKTTKYLTLEEDE